MLYTIRRLNKPIHYQELPAKILERFPGELTKINTVHNELVKNNDLFINLGLGTYGLKERGFQGGSVRDILIRIFKKNNHLREKMVSPNTVVLNLQKFKEDFQRVDKGTYAYIGE